MGAPPSVRGLDVSLAPKESRAVIEQASKGLGQISALLSGRLTFQDNLDAQWVSDLKARGADKWQTPASFSNSWVDFSGSVVARYRKLASGLVVVDGAVKSGTLNTTAFVLPEEYRPQAEVAFASDSNGAFGELVIQTDGDVIPRAGSNTHFALCASFMAADEEPLSTLAQDVVFKCALGKRPRAVFCVGAVSVSDRNTVLSTVAVPTWRYQQDGQVRVTSIPGLAPEADYLVSFLVVGG